MMKPYRGGGGRDRSANQMMLSRPIEDIHDNFDMNPNQMMR
jgi:hypothetical protein